MTPPRQSILNLDLQGAIISAVSGTFNKRQLFNDPRDIALLCESASMPGRQVTTLDDQSIRHSIKRPSGLINEDVIFSFILTNDYYIKKIFDKWQAMVLDPQRYRVKYLNEYSTDVVIQQLNKKSLPVYGIRLKNAWPVTVNAVTLDNNSENTVQKISVTMTYENYVEEGGVTSAFGSLGSIINVISNI